jgi:L-ascorbate metabolism protein UlaG (beta-lactamase superfamily)
VKVTYYGHSSFSVKVGGKNLLFDPFITSNPLAKSVDVMKIRPDFILISHGHEDHIADAIELARYTDAMVISNFEVCTWLQKKGIKRIHPMNHGGWAMFEFGPVKYVNAIHSSTMPDGSPGGNPGGFIVETSEGNFYYSGDTALTMDMKLIGEFTRLKFAVLCIGSNFTMGVDDAVRAADFIRCKEVLGVHYDTFPPITIDHNTAKEKFQAAGKNLYLLPIGASQDF